MPTKEKWYSIDTGYACFGVGVNHQGVITEAAPIAKWTIGKKWDRVQDWYKRKHRASIIEVPL
jgi:hypothetical protein